MKPLFLLLFSLFVITGLLNGQKVKPPDLRLNPEIEIPDSLTLKIAPESRDQEEFPGASRFYRKWPKMPPYSYEKSFILKPDTTNKNIKYHLIIKDPITHRITNK